VAGQSGRSTVTRRPALAFRRPVRCFCSQLFDRSILLGRWLRLGRAQICSPLGPRGIESSARDWSGRICLVYLGGAPIKVPLQLIEASGRAPSLRCFAWPGSVGRSPSVIDRSACKADADRVMTRGSEGIVSLEYIRACLCVVWFAAASARDASGSGQEAT
jgi:hypothetical protein